ncbi:MAG: DUF4190 domain-containing protein [bacterium]
MATYNFTCPKCSKTIAAESSMAGQQVQCPGCQEIFAAPYPNVTPVPGLPAGQNENSKLAIWSLVLGILSVLCCGVFSAVPAVICGHKAQTRIKASGGGLRGAGMALAGLILGYVAIGLSVIMIPLYAAIAIPSFMKVRQDSQRAACVNNLRLIDHAKQQLATATQTMQDSYVPAMSELAPYFKGPEPVCRAGGVYTVNAITSNPTCSKSGPPLQHELVNTVEY